MTASLALTEAVKSILAQAKLIRSHDHAVQAKWLANLIRRLQDTDKIDVNALAEIAERLEDACVGNTPEATIETIGQHGATAEAALNLSRMLMNLRDSLLHADKTFDWQKAHDTIDALGANYGGITPEACKRFGFSWQEREALRISTGHYKAVPWAKELKPVDGHFVHLSTQEKGLLAYTETTEKGERDVKKRIKPGKYLKENYPDLSGVEIEKLQGKVISSELQFTSDPNVIEKLYREGPQSCMAGNLAEKGMHPTRCYGDGDLAIAYLLNKSGTCSARAVVWPEKRVYYTYYGDYAKIEPALKAHGYKKSGAYCFDGARMRKHRHSQGYVLMSSFDGHGSFRLDPNDENFLIVDRNGPLHGGSPRMFIPEAVACGCGCGKKDYHLTPVLVNGPGKPAQQWIAACLQKAIKDKTIVQCQAGSGYLPARDVAPARWSGRTTYNISKARRQTMCVRDVKGEWYRIGAYHLVSLDNGELWELEQIRASKEHFLDKEDGLWKAKETAKEAA